MQKKKLILIGAGGRGRCYVENSREVENYFDVVAVAEPNISRRNLVKEMFDIPKDMCFDSWEPLLEMPKIADVAIIATMDRDHIDSALAAIEKGYNLLLEKPVAATPEECREIQNAAEKAGVFVLVCHVLRYTTFFKALKKIIDDGEIGEVMNIQHIEAVGNVHQSHSFVRGNWRNSEESTPMILQKTCHDMDILAWLIGKKCTRVHSFGSLSHFVHENAPKDAPEYCIQGCPHSEKCPYDSRKIYLDPETPDWLKTSIGKSPIFNDEILIEAITKTDFGKCVYKCPNNVVDHQVVNLEFEGGAVVSFTMSAFNKGGREIRIMGTKGEVRAQMSSSIIEIYDFLTQTTKEIDINSTLGDSISNGHGGGDTGIMFALRDMLEGIPNASVCDIRESCDNHMISFAAEESRLTGKVIDMKEFCDKY